MNIELKKPEDRKSFISEAVSTRERGDLNTALDMFLKVVAWDETNSKTNTKEGADVFGHLRITYSRLGMHEQDSQKKDEYYSLAVESAKTALKIVNTLPEVNAAIYQIHLASALSEQADNSALSSKQKTEVYEKALQNINDAIAVLPGSPAHKAWPMNTKAKLLNKLNRRDEALATIALGEILIAEGYEQEMQNEDGELKLMVWLTGLILTKAQVYADLQKTELAVFYASCILELPDPQNYLGERKKEAKALLTSITE